MTETTRPRYQRPDASIDDRVADLLERMTVEEKVGQLLVDPEVGTKDEIIDAVKADVDDYHLGQASPFGRTGTPDTPADAVEIANEVQRHAVEETRLGVPLLLISNAVHGNAYLRDAAVFPHALGMAATRNEELVEELASVTATELARTGAHQNYDPVCDSGREPRWGRTFETFGESPYLCSRLSAAKVRGYQGDGLGDPDSVIATAKHFPAYGEPEGGQDGAPVDVSEHTFRTYHLPPFEAAIDAGARSVMPCYNMLNGEPVHGSRYVLTELLREELGFDGFVVSDHHGVDMLHDEHRTTRSIREAVWQAATAGIDAWLSQDVCEEYADHLVSLVEEGALSESALDESVEHVLRAKFELGLFEDPYVDLDAASDVLGADDHRELASECSRQSLILLQNDGLLPLEDADTIHVTGPTADRMDFQLGGWSRQGREDGVSIRRGLENRAGPKTTITYETDSGIRDRQRRSLEATHEAASRADVTVVAVGEPQYIHEFGLSPSTGESGEFPTRSRLRLPEAQRELVETVADTGTPTVVVVVTGRPLSIPTVTEQASAVLQAFYPGSEGGLAIADVLFGDADPGGALPVSIPRSEGDLPCRFNHYNHPQPIGADAHPDTYDPLFPFGHGLSYADFSVEDVRVSAAVIGPAETVTVDVDVENVSDRPGETTVDVFLRDQFSTRVRPVRELVGFDRVALEPGESQTLSFDVTPDQLAVVAPDGDHEVEPGRFEVEVGDETATFQVEAVF